MKPFYLFLAVFAISLLLVGILPHLLRGQLLSIRPDGFSPAQPAALAPRSSITLEPAESILSSTDTGIPQAGAFGAAVMDSPFMTGLPAIEDFTNQVSHGSSGMLAGVYAPGLFALPIIQQPTGRAEFVSADNDVITQFSLPSKHGSTGLLAHNYLSGRKFFDLRVGQEVVLIYDDGRQQIYRIEKIVQFQALDPTSPFSRFIRLDDPTRSVLSSAELFNQVYTTPDQLVFQTCIDAFGDSSWGRIFISASPVDLVQSSLPTLGQFVSNN